MPLATLIQDIPFNKQNKNNSNDRILHLKVIDGKKPTNSIGLTDSRLFKGGNRLHAIMDKQTCLWKLEYDSGVVPNPFKQQFTGFNDLMKFVIAYYKSRNVEVTEVTNAD